jgi:hypothetical protein
LQWGNQVQRNEVLPEMAFQGTRIEINQQKWGFKQQA